MASEGYACRISIYTVVVNSNVAITHGLDSRITEVSVIPCYFFRREQEVLPWFQIHSRREQDVLPRSQLQFLSVALCYVANATDNNFPIGISHGNSKIPMSGRAVMPVTSFQFLSRPASDSVVSIRVVILGRSTKTGLLSISSC